MANQLSIQQRHLLDRVPSLYSLKNPEPEKVPSEVKRAQALVTRWTERQSKREKAWRKKAQGLIDAAREAIYFLPAEKALPAVKKVESLKRAE